MLCLLNIYSAYIIRIYNRHQEIKIKDCNVAIHIIVLQQNTA